jgi:hypothetical protein
MAAVISGWFARQAKISEFRQDWINDLRKDTADYIGAAYFWFRKYEELQELQQNSERLALERKDLLPLLNAARVTLWRIRMRINPRANSPTRKEDDDFLKSLDDLLNPGKLVPPQLEAWWFRLADSAVEQAREILKREWDVTKRLLWLPRWVATAYSFLAGRAI